MSSSKGISILLLTGLPPEIYFRRVFHHYLRSSHSFSDLLADLASSPEALEVSRAQLKLLLENSNMQVLLTETGIFSPKSFLVNLIDKVFHYLLPPVPDTSSLGYVLEEVFDQKVSHQRVEKVEDEQWIALFDLLLPGLPDNVGIQLQEQVIEAMIILSQRLAGMGFEPEFLRRNPELTGFNSPFYTQQTELQHVVSEAKAKVETDFRPLRVMYSQCLEILDKSRKNQQKIGANLEFTFSLLRARQIIVRLQFLAELTEAWATGKIKTKNITLFKELVKEQKLKHKVGDHISDTFSILALQVTEHAGRTGEHYITSGRKEYFKMFQSAAGGGFIVGFLSVFKVLIYSLGLAPFGQAFLYSLNYSLGFIGILVSHSTLATKQPAMTAARLAASLDTKDKSVPDLEGLVSLIVRTIRSQFIAVLGNIFLAFPVAFLLAYAYLTAFGSPVASVAKASHLIEELHPLSSLALFHAAIAGFYLFFSGLISGYFDNKNRYSKIAERVAHHPNLKRILGPRWLEKLSHYLDHNLGNLAGNFFLGIFLGSTAFIGMIFGLPLDIRHVTFSSASFGLALATPGVHVNGEIIFFSVLGIILIGVVNLLVSFGFSIVVAIKSRNVRFSQTRQILWLLVVKFYNQPNQFFFPPRESDVSPPHL